MLENILAKDMVSSMTPMQTEELFREGVRSQNSFIVAATLPVMARRGCFSDIEAVVHEEIAHIQLGSEFATVLGQCLYEAGGKNDITIRRFARFLNRASAEYAAHQLRAGTITFDEFMAWADEDVRRDSPGDWERMSTVKVRTNLERALALGLSNFAKLAIDELVRRGNHNSDIAAALAHAITERYSTPLRRDFPRQIADYIQEQTTNESLVHLCEEYVQCCTPSPQEVADALSILDGKTPEA